MSSTDRESEPVTDPNRSGEGISNGLGWWIVPALLVGLLLSPTLIYPFGRDQAVFAFIGRVIAEGGMPYRDAWDLKPPGIYWCYAGIAALAPSGAGMMLGVRLLDITLAMVTGTLLAELGRRTAQPEAGCAAAAWYAALYLQGGYWGLAQTEAWANPLVVGAALLCLSLGVKRWNGILFGIGLLTGCAALLKFTAILPLLPLLGLTLWRRKGQRLAGLLDLAVGASIPLALAIGWLVAGGALREYLDIQQGFVVTYSRLTRSGPLEHLGRVGTFTLAWLARLWLPALFACAAVYLLRKRPEPAARCALIMLTGGLLAAWVQDKYFGYHWHTALPGMALLAGLGGTYAANRLGAQGWRSTAFASAVAVIWSLGVSWSSYRDAAGLTTGKVTQDQWLSRFGRPGKGDHSFLANTWVAQSVAATTTPEDKLLVWGFEPSIYLFANRRSPTRFFFNVPVTAQFTPRAWREEFLRDLRDDPPQLFIVARNDAIPWATGLTSDSTAQLKTWPELDVWFRTRYQFERQVEDFALYRLRLPSSNRRY